jgi:carbamoyltransferase
MPAIVGLNAYHADSSACIVVDGKLIAAAEEERFRRIKHWAGFPSEAIAYCLRQARLSLRDVDCIALNTDPRAGLARKVAFALRQRPDPRLVLDRVRNARRRRSVTQELEQAFPGHAFAGKVQHVEHHLAHLASAFFASPFERAVAVSVDGFGDFASAAWGEGHGAALAVDGRVHFPHSLGIFYQALTQHLGFRHYGDEYKVMGLAPYGAPRFVAELRKVVELDADGSFALNLAFFRHHREKVEYAWSGGSPEVGTLYSPALCELLGPAREPGAELTQAHKDLARSVQVVYEDAFFNLLARQHMRYGSKAVVIAGGCGMNSVANGKIRLRTPFERVYVQAAAGDAGGAIGAAWIAAQALEPSVPSGQMTHAYWGPESSDAEIASLLDARRDEIAAAGCTVERANDEAELCARVARRIAAGAVVGWFQGRMEWGPRALGNRSIVCDPRRADMKDVLNLKIKRRESFRPFAPSIVREAVADWFEQDDDVPFMMQVFQIKEDKRARIPAVTHVDGSGRLQTVHERENPRYYALIRAFERETGVPMVLNTSFNENEPVVCAPAEALDCFLRTRMDVLALGQYVLERNAS